MSRRLHGHQPCSPRYRLARAPQREMERRTAAVCARCSIIKQACDLGDPCSRCKRLSVKCEPVSALASGAVLSPVKIRRTATGCTSCKKRKRKCDEIRPKCSDCRRLCLDCVYSEATSIKRKKQTAKEDTECNNPLVNSVDKSLDTSLETSTGTDLSSPDFSLEAFEGAAEFDEHLTFTHQIDTPATNASMDSASPGSELSLSILSTAPSLVLDVDKSLLNHYMKVVAVVLSRKSDQQTNPYLTNVIPMAFSNQLVMNAVLALSASHWKRMQPALWKRGMLHQTNTLQSLAKLLPHIRNETVDPALLATLLLAMTDLYDGSSLSWRFHLDGVRQLLSAYKAKASLSDASRYRTFFTQLYHYLDSGVSISTCAPPVLEVTLEEDAASPSLKADEESLYGIPKRLFHFVDKLNSLAYQRKFREDPVFSKMFEASANSLRSQIDRWAEDHNLRQPENSLDTFSQRSATQNATFAFEQALQLRLHQIVNGYALHFEKVTTCVRNILDAIQDIPYGHAIESSLIFPLVMAGGSCNTEHDRLIVDDRLRVMQKTVGFRYVYVAHDLVQRVWKEREACQGTEAEVNWASIRFYDIPGLALV